jgi:DNA-binding MarR family transcriptional regulator
MVKTDKKKKALTDIKLWELFDRTSFAIARLRELELAQFGLTLEQAAILTILRRGGGVTIAKEIEHLTMRQHHSITTLINRMIKAGLVNKEKGAEGRSYRIIITENGKSLSEKVTRTSFEAAFSPLMEKDKQKLTDYLNLLLDRARNLLGISSTPTFLEYMIASASKTRRRKKDIESEALPDFSLWRLLDRTRFAVGRLRELELAQFGLTIEQSAILTILQNRHGSAITKEIEFETMRQNHSITTLVNRMIKAGLVSKEKTGRGRRYRIVITDNGQSIFKKATKASIEMTFAALIDKDKTQFADYLNALLDKARSLLGLTPVPVLSK